MAHVTLKLLRQWDREYIWYGLYVQGGTRLDMGYNSINCVPCFTEVNKPVRKTQDKLM